MLRAYHSLSLRSGRKRFVKVGLLCAISAGAGCADKGVADSAGTTSASVTVSDGARAPDASSDIGQHDAGPAAPEQNAATLPANTEPKTQPQPTGVARAAEGPFVEPGSPRYRVDYSFLEGAGGLLDPKAAPAGANVWNCRSSTHPEPVVLVHGTLMNQNDTWATFAPLLWNEGYCVYTFNYGGPPLLGTVYGIHSIPDSAAELRDFVNQVLERTGASKVDLIGHSQGSLVSRYYLGYLGGLGKVDQLIGIAPSNHGSSVHGLEQLLEFFGVTSLVKDVLTSTVCGACAEQLSQSAMIAKINAPGDTLPGVRYTVLSTRYDELVSPVASTFLKGATNLYVQDTCPQDHTAHIGMVYDPVTLRLALNALDPASAKAPKCRFVAGGL